MSNNKKLLVITKNGKLALCKIDGSLLTDFEYDRFDNGLSSYIIATKNKKQGLLNSEGEIVVPCLYEDLRYALFHNQRMSVKRNGKYGFVDEKGRIVIPCIYDKSFYFRDEGVAEVIKDNKVLVINKSNHVFRNIVGFYKNWEDNYNNYLTYFQEGFGKVCEEGKYGFANLDGEIVIPYLYDSAGAFSDGLAKAKKADSWGYIDMIGRQISDFKYFDAGDFKYGHAVVAIQKYNEKGEYLLKGVINKNGEEVLSCQYSDIILFPNYIVVKSQNKYGAFNYSGIQIAQCIYDNYLLPFNNYIEVSYNRKKGLIDFTGGYVLPYEYEEIRDESEGLFIVKKDGKYGVVDLENNMIIPFMYANIMFVSHNLFRVSIDKDNFSLVNENNEKTSDYTYKGHIEFEDNRVFYCTNYCG